jgi:hypothetical protein
MRRIRIRGTSKHCSDEEMNTMEYGSNGVMKKVVFRIQYPEF